MSKLIIKKRKLSAALIVKLAESISTKAFEHKFADLKVRKAALAERIYLTIFGGMTSLAEVRKQSLTWPPVLFEPAGTHLAVYITSPDSNRQSEFQFKFADERPFPHHAYNRPSVTLSPLLYEVFQSYQAEFMGTTSQLSNLKTALIAQLSALGDTHTVLKTWPEVEPMLSELYGEVAPDLSSVVTPFAALLGQFLPALSAPTSGAAA